METSYTSDDLQPGYIYEYTVTPRSNVEGAQNGTCKTVTGVSKMVGVLLLILITIMSAETIYGSTVINKGSQFQLRK